MVNFIKSIIDQNDLKGGTYIEPFSGGAAIALALAIDGYMERIVTYDNHSFIHNLYINAKSLSYALSYSAGTNKHGTELLFCKQNIIIPEDLLPALE